MSESISDQKRWQQMRRQKSLANGRYWLEQVEKSSNLAALVTSDYDNLLRTIEACLKDKEAFAIAYKLLESLSVIVFGQADWDRWIVYLQEASEGAQQLGRYPEQARLLELLGSFVRFRGDLQRAEACYQAALALFKELKMPAAHARTLLKLAGLYEVQDRLVEAIDLCQQALPFAEAVSDHQLMGDMHLTLSGIYRHAYQKELALAEAQKAYDSYAAAGITTFAARAMAGKAGIYAQLGQWAEAESAAQEAMAEMASTGDIRGQASLQNDLGIAAFYQGEYRKAEAIWQQGLILCSQTQESRTAAYLHCNLGKVYTKLGEWETADEMFEEAVTGFKGLSDDFEVANTLDSLADLYEVRGDWVAYCRALQEAISRLEPVAAERAHCQKLLASMTKRLSHLPTAT